MDKLLVFDAAAVEAVGMAKAIELMREAFPLLSAGKVQVPLRTVMETADRSGMSLFMPSYAPTWKLFGLKMVTVFPKNENPLPVIQGEMLVMDAERGQLLAMLDAPAVTALRTGAASGLATDLLARQDASTLAVFGTGVQAWTQVAGVLAVRKVKRILVKGTSSGNEQDFCDRIAKVNDLPCVPLGDLNTLKEADIICTATNALTPLFSRANIRSGVHINAVGAYQSHMRELPEDIIGTCKLIVDQRAAVLHEAGEVAIPIREGRLTPDIVHAELGEVVSRGTGRTSAEEITVFKSVGNAVQDLAVARYLVGR